MRKGIISFIFFLAILGIAAETGAENRALLVGVGKYQYIPAGLPGITKDLALMKEAAGLMGFKPKQIKIVVNHQATDTGIVKAFEQWLIRGITAKDKVLFYFTGHGTQVKDYSGDEKDKSDEVLCTYNSKISKDNSTGYLSDDRLGSLISRIPTKKVFLFIDACHSGTATKHFMPGTEELVIKSYQYKGMPASPEAFSTELVDPNARYVALAAARDYEQALATAKGSLMTRSIVAAIRKSALENKGITVEDLRNIAEENIARIAKVHNLVHHPQITGNPALSKVNLMKGSSSVPGKPGPNKIPQDTAKSVWELLEGLVDGNSSKLKLGVNRQPIQTGKKLVFTAPTSKAGYLNVFYVMPGESEATLLFPNRFHLDNRTNPNQKITIPPMGAPFALRAREPKGMHLVVAFLSKHPINAYKKWIGGSDGATASLKAADINQFQKMLDGASGSKDGTAAGKLVLIVE